MRNHESQLQNSVAESPKETLVARIRRAGADDERYLRLRSGSKEPAQQSHERKPPDSVEGNYGIYAGQGLVTIDLDDSEAAPDSLLQIINSNPTFTVESPHSDNTEGHYYYSVDGALPNTSPDWGELKAAYPWYVVGPGSVLTDCQYGCCTSESPGFYTIRQNRPRAHISAFDIKDALSLSESDDTSGNARSTDPSDTSEALSPSNALAIENDMGYSLRQFKRFSDKLDTLLSEIHPKGYQSPSEADWWTMRLLYRYRFSDSDIYRIVRSWRRRDKLNRDDYLRQTLRAAKNGGKGIPPIEPLHPGLLFMILRIHSPDLRTWESKPLVGVETLNDTISAIRECPIEPFTVADLVDSHLIDWRDAKRDSVMRRTNRALLYLGNGEYVVRTEMGGEYEWETTDTFSQLSILPV